MKRFLLLFFISILSIEASIVVIKIKNNIRYKDKIEKKDFYLTKVNNIKRSCIPATKEDILSNNFRAKVYLKKDNILCKKDIYKVDKNRLIFKFGMIEIERDGKVLNQTSDYIRIKNSNGKIEKFYKDGRR